MNEIAALLTQFGPGAVLAYLIPASVHVSKFVGEVRTLKAEVETLKRSHGEIAMLQVTIGKIETSLESIQASLTRLLDARDAESIRRN